MNYFKLARMALLLGISGEGIAQINVFGPTISYQNQSGNMGKIGGYYLYGSANEKWGFRVDATANVAHFRDKWRVFPELGVSISPYYNELSAYFVETEITPYTITPKVGVSIVHFIDFAIGYGVPFGEKNADKPIKGITFSLGVNIPLKRL